MYGKIKSKLADGNSIVGVIVAIGLIVAVLLSMVAPAAAFTGIAANYDSTEGPYITVNNGGTSSFTVDNIAIDGTQSDNLGVSVEASSDIRVYLGQGTNDSANDVYYAGFSDQNIPLQSDNVVVNRADGTSSTNSYDISPTVEGTVYDSNDERLQGATVEVGSQSVTTASDGTYSLSATSLTMADIDSVDVVVDDSAHYQKTQTVSVTPDASTTVDAFLDDYEQIKGTIEIMDPNSEGTISVDGGTITVYNPVENSDGTTSKGSQVDSATTSSDGTAELDVAEGDYIVVVEHSDQYVSSDQTTEYQTVEQQITVTDDGELETVFAEDGSGEFTYSDNSDSGGAFVSAPNVSNTQLLGGVLSGIVVLLIVAVGRKALDA